MKSGLLGLLLSLLLTVGQTAQSAEEAAYSADGSQVFWFMQITDTHVSTWFNNDYGNRLVWSLTDAADVIAPWFIVATGDLTDSTNGFNYLSGPQLGEWLEYRGYLVDSGMTPDFYFDLPGNHDAYSDGNLVYYQSHSFSGQAFQTTQPAWAIQMPYGRYGFIGAATPDNNGPPWPGDGTVLLDWERDEIAQHYADLGPFEFSMLFAHHPLDQVGGLDALLDFLADEDTRYYACGHEHDAIVRIESGQVVEFRTNSMGQATENTLTVFALDHNGLSHATTGTSDPWPLVLITTPIAARFETPDKAEGSRALVENPYAPPVPKQCQQAPVRALVFDVESVSAVQMQVDSLGWVAMTRREQVPNQWRGSFDARGLSVGYHTLTVQASGGGQRSQSVSFQVADLACDIGVEDPDLALAEGEMIVLTDQETDGDGDGDTDFDTPLDGDREESDIEAGEDGDALQEDGDTEVIDGDAAYEDGDDWKPDGDSHEDGDGENGDEPVEDGDVPSDGDIPSDGDVVVDDDDGGGSGETGGGGCNGAAGGPLVLLALAGLWAVRRRR
jgi:hypothetical protein